MNRPFVAAALASAYRCSPSLREISAFMPTPVPTATAIMSIWIGKASDTAVSASSLTRVTKMLSTTL